jgi:hypothetical protein
MPLQRAGAQGAVQEPVSLIAPTAQSIEHRQSFFLQIKAIISGFKLTGQLTVLFFQLLNAALIGGFSGRWTWRTFAQAFDTVLGEITAPLRELIAVQFLLTKQSTEFAMFAGIGLGKDTQLVLGRELATCTFLQRWIGCNLSERQR